MQIDPALSGSISIPRKAEISFRAEPYEHLYERLVPAPRALEKRRRKNKGTRGGTGKGAREGGPVDKLPQKGG